jgi:Zn-dependent protease
MFSSAGSFRLFTAIGIDVFVHWSWFVMAYIWYLLVGMDDPMLFFASYAGLFSIVTLHEFGHALACRSVGGAARTIVLWPLGGVAFVKPPNRPWPMLWSIAAGPLVNVALAPVLFALAGATQSDYLWNMFVANLIMLGFNLLPIFPLDGGQMLRSLLWMFVGEGRSLRATAVIGLVSAGLLALPAIYFMEFMLLLIVGFIALQAWQGYQQARYLLVMEDRQRIQEDMLDQRIRQLYGIQR